MPLSPSAQGGIIASGLIALYIFCWLIIYLDVALSKYAVLRPELLVLGARRERWLLVRVCAREAWEEMRGCGRGTEGEGEGEAEGEGGRTRPGV